MTVLVHVATALPDAGRHAVLRRAAAAAGARPAFLQGAEATLVRVLDELHGDGVRELRLEPVTTDDPTFARSWVGRVAGHWHRQQVDPPMIHFTGCLFPCNHGPVTVVYPEGAWFGPVDADGAARLVAEHLAHDRPVGDLRLPGTTAPLEGEA